MQRRKGEDSSVFIIVKENMLKKGYGEVLLIKEMKHSLLTEAIGYVKYLHSKLFLDRIYLDETGLGAGAGDVLRESFPGIVEGVTFTQQKKMDMYSHLKVLMENQKIKYPDHPKLIEQLKDLRYTMGSNGNLKIHHSESGGFDDFADSLALACLGLQEQLSYSPFIA